MSTVLDNPGGGDCGFYAPADKAIRDIQEQYRANKGTSDFDTFWKNGLAKEFPSVRREAVLARILSIDLRKVKDNKNHKKELRFQLQQGARNALAGARKGALVRGLRGISVSEAYPDVLALVQAYRERDDAIAKAIASGNVLATNSDANEIAQRVANSLQSELQGKSGSAAQDIIRSRVEYLADKYPGATYENAQELVNIHLKTRNITANNELAAASSSTVRDFAEQTAKELQPKLQGKSEAEAQRITEAHVKGVLQKDISSSRSIIKEAALQNTQTYRDFTVLVQRYMWEDPPKLAELQELGKYNELALSPATCQLAQQKAQSLKAELQRQGLTEEQRDSKVNELLQRQGNLSEKEKKEFVRITKNQLAAKASKIETTYITQALRKDVLKDNGEPNPRSVVLRGVDALKQPRRWAAYQDVIGAAKAITGKSPSEKDFRNYGNQHWVAVVDEVREPPLRNGVAPAITPVEAMDEPTTKRQKTAALVTTTVTTETILPLSKTEETHISDRDVAIQQVIKGTASTQENKERRTQFEDHLQVVCKPHSFFAEKMAGGKDETIAAKEQMKEIEQAVASYMRP